MRRPRPSSSRALSLAALLALAAIATPACGGGARELVSDSGASTPDAAAPADASDADAAMPAPAKTPAHPGDAWRQIGHDARHTYRSSATVARPPTIAWTAPLLEPTSADSIRTVVGDDARPYVATSTVVHAFDADGALRWSWTEPLPEAGTFGIAGVGLTSTGTLVVVDASCEVRFFSPDGALLREVDASDPALGPSALTPTVSPPTIADDDTTWISISSSRGPQLVGIGADGAIRARRSLAKVGRADAPSIGADGALIVPVRDTELGGVHGAGFVALASAEGPSRFFATALPPSTPAIAADGSLRAAARYGGDFDLVALEAAGAPRFDVGIGVVIPDPPMIDPDGVAYLGLACGVVAFDPSGALRWQTACGGTGDHEWALHVWASGAISGDGVVVVSDAALRVAGVLDGKEIWAVQREVVDPVEPREALAIGPDGTIYAGSRTGVVYALR